MITKDKKDFMNRKITKLATSDQNGKKQLYLLLRKQFKTKSNDNSCFCCHK